MKAEDRAKRDTQVLEMFVGGATYRQIGAQVGLKSTRTIHTIIQRELAAAAQRRGLLTDEAYAIHQERTERLFLAHWTLANKPKEDGSHRSAEICRRILAQQAKLLYGLDADASPLPAPTATAAGQVEDDQDQAPQDELARLRAQRAGA